MFSFEIRELKAMYKELLESDNISYSSHIHLVFLFKKEHYYLYQDLWNKWRNDQLNIKQTMLWQGKNKRIGLKVCMYWKMNT